MHKEDFYYCDEPTIVEEQKSAFVNRYKDWEMQIKCIENAWIIPWSKEYEDIQGEILTENGTIVENVCSGSIYDTMQSKTYSIPIEFDSIDEVIYLGGINKCWGHYITDGICKLWCINTPEIKLLLEKNIPIVFTYEWIIDEKMASSWRHLIDLLGWKNVNIFPLTKITKIKRIHIPSNSLQYSTKGRFYTYEFKHLIDSLKNAALSHNMRLPKIEKIYLSRTRLTSDHAEFGEKGIEKLFKKAGFKILYPEQLSFEEQVYYLHNAKEVAGTMGSISHNFMFCNSETKLYILRKSWYTNDFQYVINQVSNLDVTYIDVNLSVFLNSNSNDGPFFLYVNDNLKRFFQDKYSIKVKKNFNSRSFSNYAMICMRRPNFKDRNIAPEYYYKLMTTELTSDISIFKRGYRYILSLLGSKISSKISLQIKRLNR